MKTVIGCAFSLVLLAALGYSFNHLVLRPASAAVDGRSAVDRLPSAGETMPAPLAARLSPAAERMPGIEVALPPTPADLIAVLEHGTDEQAAAAARELVAAGDPALAPLAVFNARWRQALVTLTTAEAEIAATGEAADLSASIRKAGRAVTRSGAAMREITRRKAEIAVKTLRLDPPAIPAASDE